MEPKLPEFPEVKILECHALPELVGKAGKIITYTNPDISKYPLQIILISPIKIKMDTPMGEAEVDTIGPFPFRPDEVELITETEISSGLEKLFEGMNLDPTQPEENNEDNESH